MGKKTFSQEEKSIESIWSWYEDQKEALRDFKNKIISSFKSLNPVIYDKFLTFTLNELNDYFNKSDEELEHLVCFDLISATEALLRLDFHKKVHNKDKSELGRIFRQIYKEKGDKFSLEKDIIEKWKVSIPNEKSKFSNFLGLLKYRHWLAHGRYWPPKFGRKFTPDVTYGIVDNILDIIDNK